MRDNLRIRPGPGKMATLLCMALSAGVAINRRRRAAGAAVRRHPAHMPAPRRARPTLTYGPSADLPDPSSIYPSLIGAANCHTGTF